MDARLSHSGLGRPGSCKGDQADTEILAALFATRFERLRFLIGQRGAWVSEDDWRLRLLHKALYSTWRDLRNLPASGEQTYSD